ncbi:MAG: hypothetical protein NZ562_00695, partial [Thermomicrobium sp.]|nr:hypothetical protein [Thermomicrobium sp.]
QSPTFPGAGVRPGGPGDAVLVALDPALATVTWATYIGGSGDDVVYAVDASILGIFVVGQTTSFSDFPGTLIGPGGGNTDAFIARLDSTDGTLLWAHRIGGNASVYVEEFRGVQAANGAVYAVGTTDSDWQAAGIPNGAYDTTFDRSGSTPPLGAPVVVRFDPDGNLTAWTYNSTPGGNSYAYDLTVWESGLAVVGNSCGVHSTAGAFQTSCQGGDPYGDGWLAVFSPDLQTLLYGSFIGSTGSDVALQVRADSWTTPDLLWVAGETDSADFPTTDNALQGCGNGGYDAFLLAIAPDGGGPSDLRYGTCLGSSGPDAMDALIRPDVLGLAVSAAGPVGPGWTPPGSAFFDDTYNGASGTVNDYLALLDVGGNATAPTVTVRAWSYLGSDRDLYAGAGGLDYRLEEGCEGDVCYEIYFLARATRQDGQLLDGLPRNLPVGPAGVLQPQPAGDQDVYLAVWLPLVWSSSGWYVPPARAASAQLTVVGQGTVRSSVWDWDGPTPLRFTQAGPGTQSVTVDNQRPFLNQLVWLAATPSTGWAFQGWSGDCTGTDPVVQVTVDQDFACTATFVPAGSAGADLVVTQLTADRLVATVRVANTGSSPAAASAVALRCSLTPSGGSTVATTTLPPLAAGQSVTVQLRYSCRSNYLVAVADPANSVPEANETNNQRAVRLR